MKRDNYKLELPGGAWEFLAMNDKEAIGIADRYLVLHHMADKQLKLFRYPKEWVERGGQLIEIPEFRIPATWMRGFSII